jgi:chemotaxis protein methyltransferase CheR
MDQKVFQHFRDLIHRESGIALNKDKVALLSNRVSKRLRALCLSSIDEYLHFLERDDTGDELVNLLDVISTNVTYFFREPEHFTFLAEVFKKWNSDNRSRIRLWCAAASSGEEPYTLAITAKNNLDSRADFRMLATDICTNVLSKAQIGEYSPEQLRNVPAEIIRRYFRKTVRDDKDLWQVDSALGQSILFKRLNLNDFPYPLKGPFDIIFCRNVMIYFDLDLRRRIINEFNRLLAPGGYLFISRSETLLGIDHPFKSAAVSVYQKPSLNGASR